ncbi:hypothetical protein [Hydrotalea sp.]|uniref:MutS-related protein n=1 Tax=Hydrotalea sp. TaxID=2881279 RepID=UPI00260FF8B6|nr:hypothetical protein [Hydrotalea sp.]
MDAQTLLDLEILESTDGKNNHLFHLLNHTITQGGEDVLKHKITQAFLSFPAIKQQQQIIQHCIPLVQQWRAIIHEKDIVSAELYLQSNIQINELEPNVYDKWIAKLFKWQHPDYFHYVHTNIVSLQNLLGNLNEFISQNPIITQLSTEYIYTPIHNICTSTFAPNTTALSKKEEFATLSIDEQLRKHKANYIKNILEWIYEADAIMSMAQACIEHNLQFPEITEACGIEIHNFRHLMIKDPIVNDILLTQQNILFVTGPNMAGKTTYLKAIAHALLLSHIGMGIPATVGKIGVFKDLFSFIGITDSISKGESYFQAEINRIKLMAECLQKKQAVAVIIDEAFKGTNIKDALDCTILFTELSLQWSRSYFIIATHLTEVYTDFKNNSHIAFYYFETKQEADQLIFDYKCKPGLSEQRLGLAIFKKNGLPLLMTPKERN